MRYKSQRCRPSEARTYGLYVHARNPRRDAELQRRRFLWDERWSLKRSLGPGVTEHFERKPEEKGGRGMKRWKWKKKKKKRSPGATGFADTSLCLCKWGKNGVWCGHKFLSSPPASHCAATQSKSTKTKQSEINGSLFFYTLFIFMTAFIFVLAFPKGFFFLCV